MKRRPSWSDPPWTVALTGVALVSACGHAAATRVATTKGDGYTISCARAKDCVRKADKVCRGEYDIQSREGPKAMDFRCRDGAKSRVYCDQKPACDEAAQTQCASYRELDFQSESRIVVTCRSPRDQDAETETHAEQPSAPPARLSNDDIPTGSADPEEAAQRAAKLYAEYHTSKPPFE